MTDQRDGKAAPIEGGAASGVARNFQMWMFAGGALLLALVVAFIWIDDSRKGGDSGPEGSAYEARKNCERAVAPMLKNPSSAEYANMYADPAAANWTVTGTVSGANALGGRASFDFTCIATDTGSSWSTDVIDFTELG